MKDTPDNYSQPLSSQAGDLKRFRTFGLTLLQLMAVLALVGLLAKCILHFL